MQTIYLDISNKGVYPCIYAKQSEVGRKFLAVITDNGVPYNIPSDSLLSVWYEGDTDAGNYSSINEESAFSVDGNRVTVELVAQMFLQPGNGELCLSVTHGDGRETNTWNIPYCVEYKPGASSSVPTEYYTALTEAGAEAARHATSARNDAQIAASYGRDFLLTIYPVGSIYMTIDSVYPGNIFGGTWTRIEDAFLIGSGSKHYATEVGGSETHTMATAEMPKHNHANVAYLDQESTTIVPAGNVFWKTGYAYASEDLDNKNKANFGYTKDSGGGAPFSIMPPYYCVHIWRRTA